MTAVYKDAVVDQSTTEGLSDFTLAGAATGYRGIVAAGYVDTDTLYYCARNPAVPSEWEVGLGTLSGSTLARTTIIASSTGSKVSFSPGTKTISVTLPASVLASVVEAALRVNDRNAIINGGFDIWQRTTSQNPTANAVHYIPDRFYMYQAGGTTGNYTVARQGAIGAYRCRISYNSGSPSSTQRFAQIIESNHAAKYAGKTVTLQAKLKRSSGWNENVTLKLSSGTGTDQGSAALEGGTWTGLTIEAQSTIALTETETVYSVTATLGASVAELAFKLEWPQGSLPGGAYIEVGEVQLREGSAATAFALRSFQEEMLLCQRYYEKSYAYATVPGAAATPGMAYQHLSGMGGTNSYFYVPYKVRKRVVPTVTAYSPNNGASGQIYDFAGATNRAALIGNGGEYGFSGGCASLSAGLNWGFNWTSSAEL